MSSICLGALQRLVFICLAKSDNKELYHPMVDRLLLQPALRLR